MMNLMLGIVVIYTLIVFVELALDDAESPTVVPQAALAVRNLAPRTASGLDDVDQTDEAVARVAIQLVALSRAQR